MLNLPTELPDQALEDFLLAGARGIPPQPNWLCTEPPPRYVAAPERRQTALQSLMQCASELLRRQSIKALQKDPTMYEGPPKASEYLVRHFHGYEAEAFVVMFLDAQHRFITIKELFRGTVSQTSVYPREVVKQALALNASAVILSHNHPSGSVEPSRADENLTQTLKSALALVDVRVLDHIVVGGSASTSFAERGIL